MAKPYQGHLKKQADLVTKYENIRAGFVAFALEKNRRATPFVQQARALKSAASKAKKPIDLLLIEDIRSSLLTAAGVSDKAANHLLEDAKLEATKAFIKNFLEPAGADFIEELVYRFLLTRGDTLGGSMRNIVGMIAQQKFSRALLSELKLLNISYYWLDSSSDKWIEMPEDDTDIETHMRGISWKSGIKERTLIYNLTVPFIGNNIDLNLFKISYEEIDDAIKKPGLYIALGELKGGIDPAGADEHWKTARTALVRINKASRWQKVQPQTFFIGAAIEKKMAGEIWEQLQSGQLINAANLTEPDQLFSLCRWLIEI